MAELIDPNIGNDGYPIDHRQNERAGILSTIMFLERLARTAVSEPDRKEARFQADYLRSLVRRRSRDGKDTLDGALREALQKLMAPPPQQLQAPVRQLPHDPNVIDAP